MVDLSALEAFGFWKSYLPRTASLLDWASKLGTPRPAWSGGPLVDRLKPTPEDEAKPRSLSERHGLGAFPLHTDAAHHRTPPRITVLRLLEGGRPRRPTLLLDWLDVAGESLSIGLRYGSWLVRAGRHRFYRPAVERSKEGHSRIRYDEGCMTPATPVAEHAAKLMSEALSDARLHVVDWTEGSLVVIDNWRVLHARGEDYDGNDLQSRAVESWILERILLDVEEGQEQ